MYHVCAGKREREWIKKRAWSILRQQLKCRNSRSMVCRSELDSGLYHSEDQLAIETGKSRDELQVHTIEVHRNKITKKSKCSTSTLIYYHRHPRIYFPNPPLIAEVHHQAIFANRPVG